MISEEKFEALEQKVEEVRQALLAGLTTSWLPLAKRTPKVTSHLLGP